MKNPVVRWWGSDRSSQSRNIKTSSRKKRFDWRFDENENWNSFENSVKWWCSQNAEWEKKFFLQPSNTSCALNFIEIAWNVDTTENSNRCNQKALHQYFNRDYSRYVRLWVYRTHLHLAGSWLNDVLMPSFSPSSIHCYVFGLWWNSARKRGEFVVMYACVYVWNGKKGQKNVESCSFFCSCQTNVRTPMLEC